MKTKKRRPGRPKIPGRKRVEIRLDGQIFEKMKALAKTSGAPSIQGWLVLVIHKAVAEKMLYG